MTSDEKEQKSIERIIRYISFSAKDRETLFK